MTKLSHFVLGLGLLATAFNAGASDFNVTTKIPTRSFEAMQSIKAHLDNKDVRRMPTRADELDNSVIYEAPEGKVEHYNTTGMAYMAIMGFLGELPVEDFDTEIVYCDNGDVYWKNSITMIGSNTYIKGVDKGDVIEFTFPQCIMSYPDEEGSPVNIYAHRMKYEVTDESGGWFFIDTDNDVVTLTKNEDGTLVGDVLGGESILGMTTPEGEWYGYGNYNIVMTPGLEAVVTPPSDLETEEWAMISDGVGKFIKVGFDGSDVYVTNVFEEMPNAWIKGTIEDDEVIFPSNQFEGVHELIMFNAYFKAVTLEYDEEYDEDVIVEQEQAVCKYDAENKIMVSDVDFALIAGPGFMLGYVDKPTIRWQPSDFEITLENPVIVDCFNYDDYLNYGVLAFEMPALTKEGYALNPDFIFFRMFVDGEEYEFDPADYMDIDETMIWVPFLMDNYDIHSEGSYHRFDLFIDGVDVYGIQAKYDDGENLYFTDIVSTDVSKIGEVVSDSKRVVSTEFSTVSGVKAHTSAKGLLIKTETLEDGTKRSTKIIRR